MQSATVPQTTIDEQQVIAQTILSQLGGNRFLAMTGANNLMALDGTGGLRMNLRKNGSKAKYLFITYLRAADVYKMEFSTVKKFRNGDFEIVTVAEFSGVEASQLRPIFTSVTGMYTNL